MLLVVDAGNSNLVVGLYDGDTLAAHWRLANRRRALESKQREAKVKAEAKRDQAERAYRKAMKEWAG